MANLNYFVVSAALGATIGPRIRGSAGPLTFRRLANKITDVLKEREPYLADLADAGRSDERFVKRLRRAFEASRESYSIDRVIADPELNWSFLQRCSAFGLDNDAATLNRSLLTLRKASMLSGLRSRRTVVKDQWRFSFASEIAARAMYFRYGLSVDAFLCRPQLVDEFDHLAALLAPGFTRFQYRWCALNIRKRGISKLREGAAASKKLKWNDWTGSTPVSRVPHSAGICELLEGPHILFVAESSDLRESLETQQSVSKVTILEKGLWRPDPRRLHWSFAQADGESHALRKAMVSALVRRHKPVFNIPRGVHCRVA
jgi:hypothetical protein